MGPTAQRGTDSDVLELEAGAEPLGQVRRPSENRKRLADLIRDCGPHGYAT